MKKIISIIVLFSTACTYNSEEELGAQLPDVSEELVNFDTEVRPILDENCSITGCHVSGGISPNLEEDDVVVANATTVSSEVESGSMPRGRTLTVDEKSIIISWVEQGANLD